MENLNNIISKLKENGIKITPQRLEICRELLESREHPDAAMVYNKIKERMPSVSLDTVYRTLHTLADLGIISTVGIPLDKIRFDGNEETHHHFICIECKTVYDFHDENLNNLPTPQGVEGLGEVTSRRVELKGICKNCMH